MTLWRKQSNGEWKVELDNGIGHAQTAKPTDVDSPPLAKDVAPSRSKTSLDAARTTLAASDRIASLSLATHFADDIRLYRDGGFPVVGKTAAQKRLAEFPAC